MGSKNTKENIEAQTMIFDIFSTLKWLERIWKVFCFRFEYKYYRNDTGKYMITWEEFEGTFLDEFIVDPDAEGIDVNHWIIYHTFKKIFEYNNYEIRVYRVYLFFFPYCLHLNGAEGLNFIDLLFDKIIYNLEVEMSSSHTDLRNLNTENSILEDDEENGDAINEYFDAKDKNTKKINDNSSKISKGGIILNKLVNDKKNNLIDNSSKLKNNNKSNDMGDTSRPILNQNNQEDNDEEINNENGNKRRHKMKSALLNQNQFAGSGLEANLLKVFHNEYVKRKQLGYIRLISFDVFKEIMYVYFQNNIVLFIKAFKDILNDFKDYEHVDDNLVEKIKAIDKNNISLDSLNSKNINKFLNNTYEKKLFGVRDNLKRDEKSNELFLTFDDIYVYMKNNYYFYNSKSLYEQFILDILI